MCVCVFVCDDIELCGFVSEKGSLLLYMYSVLSEMEERETKIHFFDMSHGVVDGYD